MCHGGCRCLNAVWRGMRGCLSLKCGLPGVKADSTTRASACALRERTWMCGHSRNRGHFLTMQCEMGGGSGFHYLCPRTREGLWMDGRPVGTTSSPGGIKVSWYSTCPRLIRCSQGNPLRGPHESFRDYLHIIGLIFLLIDSQRVCNVSWMSL